MKKLSELWMDYRFHKFENLFNKTLLFLLAFSILLLPLNGLPYIQFFGELSYEGATYSLFLFLILFLIYFIQKRDLKLPHQLSFYFLLAFFAWVFLSGLINSPEIITNLTKGRSGLEKFTLQLIVFIFVFILSLSLYSILRSLPPFKILTIFRRWILLSFLVAGLFSLFLEIPAEFGQKWAISSLVYFSKLLGKAEPALFDRVHSFSSEASSFGMYLAVVFPWIMSYFFTSLKQQKIWSILLIGFGLVLTYLTYSRTAYFIVGLQVFMFTLVIFIKGSQYQRKRMLLVILLGVLLLLGALIFTNAGQMISLVVRSLFDKDSPFQTSNIPRLSSQLAALKMGLDHPLVGVGFGQYGFNLHNYIPSWASDNMEIKLWVSTAVGTPWPPVHGLWARILGETGFVGLILWLSMWITLLIALWKRYLQSRLMDPLNGILLLSLILCVLGLILNGFVADSLRFYAYWIVLSVAWTWLSYSMENQNFSIIQ